MEKTQISNLRVSIIYNNRLRLNGRRTLSLSQVRTNTLWHMRVVLVSR